MNGQALREQLTGFHTVMAEKARNGREHGTANRDSEARTDVSFLFPVPCSRYTNGGRSAT
jgi:hypothetical protein